VFAVYLVTYGVARFLIERIRTDSLYIGPLPAAFWLSGLLIVSGVVLFVLLRQKPASPRLDSAHHVD
jgi:prolipoprotein diacylglyceryltransferase